MKVDALVLAGAGNEGPLQQADSTPYEALIDIEGRPMVSYVLAALRAANTVGRIAVIGPREPLMQGLTANESDAGVVEGVEFLESAGDLVANVLDGMERLGSHGRILVITSDIPLLSGEMVDDFVSRCGERQADLYYPLISREHNRARYPAVQRTYFRLRDGVYTGGNCVLVDPTLVGGYRSTLANAVNMRKSPWQMTRLLGIPYTIKFLCGRLSLPEIEARIQRVFGFRVAAIICPWPEVGVDVDKPSDLQLVRDILAARR